MGWDESIPEFWDGMILALCLVGWDGAVPYFVWLQGLARDHPSSSSCRPVHREALSARPPRRHEAPAAGPSITPLRGSARLPARPPHHRVAPPARPPRRRVAPPARPPRCRVALAARRAAPRPGACPVSYYRAASSSPVAAPTRGLEPVGCRAAARSSSLVARPQARPRPRARQLPPRLETVRPLAAARPRVAAEGMASSQLFLGTGLSRI